MQKTILLAFLTAVSTPAQSATNTFGKLPKIEFKKGAWAPMYLPDDHDDNAFRKNAFLAVKEMITDRNIDTIWLEGYPNGISDNNLRPMLKEDLRRRYELAEPIRNGTAFKSSTFTMPLLYAEFLEQVEGRLSPFNGLIKSPKPAHEWHEDFKAFIALLRFQPTTEYILFLRTPLSDYRTFASGLTYFEALEKSDVHFVGIEQGDHYEKWLRAYSGDVALTLIKNIQVYKQGTADLRAYADALAALGDEDRRRSQDIADLREAMKSLEESLNYAEAGAKARISEIVRAWPDSVQKVWQSNPSSILEFVHQERDKLDDVRSRDWEHSYEITVKNRTIPRHDLLIGGVRHQPVLIKTFKEKDLELYVLPAEKLGLKLIHP